MASVITDRLSREFADFMISVTDPAYGAAGNGTTNDTEAIQAAIDAAYTQGGGTVYFPAGTYAVTTLTKVFNVTGGQGGTQKSVNLVGAGSQATRLTKFSGALPIINFSNSNGLDGLEAFSCVRGMSIEGNDTNDGIKLTDLAYIILEDVNIENCVNALNGLGLLLFSAADCKFRANVYGALIRMSSARPNCAWFNQCVFNNNTAWGIDYGDGAMISINQCDLEQNGATGNVNTGAIIIRATVDDGAGVGYGQVAIKECWFENNDGTTIKSEAATSLMISIADCKLIADEVAGNIASGIIAIDRVNCSAGTITLAGSSSSIRDSLINVITDTCTQQARMNTWTSTYDGGVKIPVVATGSIPAAGAGKDGLILIEDVGAGDRNLIIYAGGQRFRIDGGGAV